MKSRYIAPSLLMAGLIAVGSPAAMASDELAGALFGAGAGAIVGHAIGGNDAAIAGGIFGAIVGAAVADDDRRSAGPRPHAVYGPPAVRYYAPPPAWAGPQNAPPRWRHERHGYGDGYWAQHRHERHDGRRDHDRNGWDEGDGPRAYRNW